MAKAILCPTPTPHCSGSSGKQATSIMNHKIHRSSGESFNCYARYLVQVMGYEKIGGREFRPPPDSEGNPRPILVLDKKIRFGGRVRSGKGEKAGSRWMPHKRTGGLVF